ncbi:MAG: hypothetical protein NVS2B12_26170 [Ktedonobacteraceae bacterium]
MSEVLNMANENVKGSKQVVNNSKPTSEPKAAPQGLGTVPSPTPAPRKSNKGGRPVVGGSAVPGARSTQPRKLTENANQQQQQLESYNRDMRRRMERMGQGDDEQRSKSVVEQRKKRAERLKQRREEQLAHVKKSLPGGKIDTSPRRVYFMIAGVAIAIIILIAVFAVLRANGVL